MGFGTVTKGLTNLSGEVRTMDTFDGQGTGRSLSEAQTFMEKPGKSTWK